MNEQEALSKMIGPNMKRKAKWLGGVTQIHITRACDQACFNCTQGSQLAGKPVMMSPDEFEQCCLSLKNYWGVVGVFGGNPPMNPHFEEICKILKKHIPFRQRGLWCNNPLGKGNIMKETFNPGVSNLNVHKSREAYKEFKRDWPESHPFGLDTDSRHSPCYVAMKDVLKKECPNCDGEGLVFWKDGENTESKTCPACNGDGEVYDKEKAWELISNCDINQHWSAMVCKVPGKGLRGFFCEIAGAQSMLHANDPSWPDTGIPIVCECGGTGRVETTLPDNKRYKTFSPCICQLDRQWWELPMQSFAHQVRYHCHRCSVPLRLYGQLALTGETEEVSETHKDIYKPKVKDRKVSLVTLDNVQDSHTLALMTDYIGNSKR